MATYTGTLAADTITTGADDYQVVYGLDGNDTIYSYYNPFEDPSGTFPTSRSGVVIEGGAGNDSIYLSGVYSGYVGSRTGYTLRTVATYGTVYGGDGDDTVYGNPSGIANGFDDTFYGGNGNDVLVGGGGNDILDGGAGRDYLVGGAGNDVLDAGGGVGDSLYGGVGNDVLLSLDLSFTGNSNYLSGDDGDDRIWGSGNDTLVGGAGNDTIAFFGSTGALTFVGNTGAQGYGGDGNDTLVGDGARNYFQGDAGNDVLYGFAGNDVLVGGDGNDSLTGGAGTDLLYGGAGTDGFYFTDGFVVGEFDQVADFQAGIDLVFLPAAFSGVVSVTDTSLGALVSAPLGTSSAGAYFSGASAADVRAGLVFV